MKIPSLQSRESKGGSNRESKGGSNRELSGVIGSNRELSKVESPLSLSTFAFQLSITLDHSRLSITLAFHFRFSTLDNSRSLSPFAYLSELITSSFLLRLISTRLLSFKTANPSWSIKDMYFLLTRWLLCVRINCCGVSRVSYSPSVLEIR